MLLPAHRYVSVDGRRDVYGRSSSSAAPLLGSPHFSDSPYLHLERLQLTTGVESWRGVRGTRMMMHIGHAYADTDTQAGRRGDGKRGLDRVL
jgi:hypothetical protein